VHPRGESKKFDIVRGESKEKKLQVGKTKLAHIIGVSTYLPFFLILHCRIISCLKVNLIKKGTRKEYFFLYELKGVRLV
jgi:hypothetical protein